MLDFVLLFFLSALPSSGDPVDSFHLEVQQEDPLALLLAEEDAEDAEDGEDNFGTGEKKKENNTLTTSIMDLQKGPVQDSEKVAVVTTNKGSFVLRFFSEEAPKTVENFTGLAEDEYYNGIIFHRVIDGFMIQGGDPTGTGMGGESFWGGKFEDEFSGEVSNLRGSISMANAGPGTNGSQFFINTVDNKFLDNRHSVFGEVIEGMDVVDAIVSVDTDASDKPLEEVKMESVTVMLYSEYQK